MDTSVFMDKAVVPGTDDLCAALEKTFDLWNAVRDCVHEKYPEASDGWHYSGKKFGWSFRISDKKRVIVYLLPRKGYFKTAFVFGAKATDAVMKSAVSEDIKEQLRTAKVYAEGRGLRIDVTNTAVINDVIQLIGIKLMY